MLACGPNPGFPPQKRIKNEPRDQMPCSGQQKRRKRLIPNPHSEIRRAPHHVHRREGQQDQRRVVRTAFEHRLSSHNTGQAFSALSEFRRHPKEQNRCPRIVAVTPIWRVAFLSTSACYFEQSGPAVCARKLTRYYNYLVEDRTLRTFSTG